MSEENRHAVRVAESGNGRYGQIVTIGHHVFGADEPEAMGGLDSGPDPFELVMAGLGACTAMTLRMYAARKQWPLEHIDVTVRQLKVVAADGKTQRDKFERRIVLKGALDAEQRARLIQVADACPVSKMLQAGAEVTAAEVPEAP
ncbi:OsmC family protein [Zavarzinia sp.]|uniref:OsmC family protein n=1 Tax=Zavarzinia sp. TaxID=2027920 RepID=UPI003561AACD